jgi:hypothetical protein
MIRNVIYGFLLAVLCLGCEQPFSPKIEFKERDFLFCIVTIDLRYTNGIEVYLTRSYDVPGFDPSVDTTDKAIRRAKVTYTSGGKTDTLKEYALRRQDSSRYHNRMRIYSASAKLKNRDTFAINAALPNGGMISGKTVIPNVAFVTSRPNYDRGVTTLVNRFTQGDTWYLDWEDYVNEDHLYFPTLVVQYEKTVDSNRVQFSSKIPSKYVDVDGVTTPYFVPYTRTKQTTYSFDTIDRAMRSISEGDTNKADYRILKFVFKVVEFDGPLSNYYSSVHGYLDNYSVRLDESIYSNIQGGSGIVGTAMSNTFEFLPTLSYVKYLGYTL